MIRISSSGSGQGTMNWLRRIGGRDVYSDLERYGQLGVQALSRATPVETGRTAASWGYRVIRSRRFPGIEWYNTNLAANETPIAVLLQYGHATRDGGYIPGYDYINPALQPIFDQIAQDVWKKVNDG